MKQIDLSCGDSRTILGCYDDNSVDSVVTDPPYALESVVKRFGKDGSAAAKDYGKSGAFQRASAGFMGLKWDTGETAFDPSFWVEVKRVLKPGGYVLAFSGSRTYHKLASAIDDAGFEIRDMCGWLYGSGFPKSHDAGNGWGTALKPAHEPICMARKPLIGTVAKNVAAWGTGAINIDECRVATTDSISNHSRSAESAVSKGKYGDSSEQETHQTEGQLLGRFPANIMHDGSTEVSAMFPDDKAKFFYAPKANQADRDHGLENFDATPTAFGNQAKAELARGNLEHDNGDSGMNKVKMRKNTHPTVKPTELMRYFCRLVTPKNGVILDPFMGSGSTGRGAVLEGFNFIGIDMEPKYVEIAHHRIAAAAAEAAMS